MPPRIIEHSERVVPALLIASNPLVAGFWLILGAAGQLMYNCISTLPSIEVTITRVVGENMSAVGHARDTLLGFLGIYLAVEGTEAVRAS